MARVQCSDGGKNEAPMCMFDVGVYLDYRLQPTYIARHVVLHRRLEDTEPISPPRVAQQTNAYDSRIFTRQLVATRLAFSNMPVAVSRFHTVYQEA